MYELSKAEKVARYLKAIPNLTTNKLVQYCWDKTSIATRYNSLRNT